MSGIYIKGMDMPSCCVVCPFVGEKLGWCIVSGEFQEDAYRPQTCPLIQIPPHGRLIDADALFDFILNIYKTAQGGARKAYSDVLDTIVAAGDVIPEEDEDT